MFLLIKRPHFRRLWASQLVSLMGDWLSLVAVSLLALHEGDGIVALAMVLVAHSLPTAVMSPIVGALTDRFDRIRLIITSNLAQLVLTLAMVGSVMAGSLIGVQILLVLRTAAAAVVMPAQQASLPRLVAKDELYRANAITAATWSFAFTVGMALGGVLALLGPELALLIDSATFAIAAWLVRPLPAIVAERGETVALGTAISRAGKDTLAAARLVFANRPLLGSVLAKMPVAFAGGGGWVLVNLRAADPAFIAAGSVALGILHATRGLGTGIGPLLGMRRIEAGVAEPIVRDFAAWAAFLSLGLFTVVGWWPISLAAAFLWGCGAGMNWVVSSTGVQRIAPDEIRGRTTSIDLLLATAGTSIGVVLAALLVDATGDPEMSGWLGVSVGVALWLGFRILSRARLEQHAEGEG